MRSESKDSEPIVHVLNGFYPEADVGRLTVAGLEELVAALVKCTTSKTDRPKWWPTSITYNRKINLGLDNEREIKLALKQLIANCSQFFNGERDGFRDKWSVEWSNENQKKKRPRRRLRPLAPILPIPFVRLERPPIVPGSPSKQQFLQYFRLSPKQCKIANKKPAPPPGATVKLANTNHIPVSSDIGRLLITKEQHNMLEEVKLKRLERSEWYTNRNVKTTEVEFEVAPTVKEPQYCHNYQMPKRQFHQRRPGMHDAQFLAQFCTPVYVCLERLNLNKVKREGEARQLVVVINKNEQMCCDAKVKTRIVRTSTRLRHV